jgi:chemotaxis protein MotB
MSMEVHMSGIVSKLVGVGILGLSLAMTGCNKEIKSENEQLRTQNGELTSELEEVRTRISESEAQRQQAEAAKTAQAAEVATLRAQLLAAQSPPAPAPRPDMGTGGGSAPRTGGGNSSDGGREVVIEVAGDVLFGSGSATLSAGGRRELDNVARRLLRDYAGRSIRVEGYTDSDPIRKSRWGSNQALSQARAEAVEKYLVSKGLPSRRISAVGMGAARPKATKAQSRRVEIVIIGQ